MHQEVGLSKSSRIAKTLENEIRSGRMSRGDQLASESKLVRRFSVSRNTVRKGLEQLSQKGLIMTRTGIGSFVTYDGASIDNSRGWTLALSKSVDNVETRILRLGRGTCAKTSAFLSMGTIDFLHVERLRVLSTTGIGISLECSRSPWRREFESVLESGLKNSSLSSTLTNSGLVAHHGEEWADVIQCLPQPVAQIMLRTPGDAMLRLRRVTRTADGDVVEFVESTLDPTKFGLHLEF